mmetsp:Transcript_6288/g.24498  ORF Transcript_6288/g.24498 Transcript_6288/m.24498 type:complete len:281 (-) Transcript_6288:210-1052(-)
MQSMAQHRRIPMRAAFGRSSTRPNANWAACISLYRAAYWDGKGTWQSSAYRNRGKRSITGTISSSSVFLASFSSGCRASRLFRPFSFLMNEFSSWRSKCNRPTALESSCGNRERARAKCLGNKAQTQCISSTAFSGRFSTLSRMAFWTPSGATRESSSPRNAAIAPSEVSPFPLSSTCPLSLTMQTSPALIQTRKSLLLGLSSSGMKSAASMRRNSPSAESLTESPRSGCCFEYRTRRAVSSHSSSTLSPYLQTPTTQYSSPCRRALNCGASICHTSPRV